jgi:hypothetical protein
VSPQRFAFRFADLDDGATVLTNCRSCGAFKTLDPDVLPTAARDLELRELETRVRCQSRGRDGRKPPCGGRVEFSIDGVKPFRSPLRDYDYGTP